jgi:hypothetical protein
MPSLGNEWSPLGFVRIRRGLRASLGEETVRYKTLELEFCSGTHFVLTAHRHEFRVVVK